MFRKDEAAVLAASLAVTDGWAPLVAKLYTRQVYRHPVKQTEGTVAAIFMGTVLYCYLYQWWLGFALLPLRIVLAYGGVAAAVGTLVKGVDNVAVPIALHLLIPRIQEWLPA
jgi:dolichol kinase